jgi:F-type H+-transporting ATPase subunit epsilon
MPLTIEIVTPEERVYSDTVDSVVIPTVEGEVGILPGHLPLLTQMDHGELQVTKGNSTQLLVVGSGFAQIAADKVSILAEHAVSEERIDEHAAEEAIKRAQADLKEAEHMDPNEFEHLQNMIRFAGTQLALKRRRR